MADGSAKAIIRNEGSDTNRALSFTAISETVSQGTIMILKDPRKAMSASQTTFGVPVAGITTADLESGEANVGCIVDAVVELSCSGSVVAGDRLMLAGYNYVGRATAAASGACIVGYALETGSDEEAIEVQWRVGG